MIMNDVPNPAQWVNQAEELLHRYKAEAIAARHHLHRNPDLSGEEENTVRYLKEILRQWITDTDQFWQPLPNALVVLLPPTNSKQQQREPAIALRADLDALPIQEQTKVAWASAHPGKMHACGHDVHTAGLLLALAVLAHMPRAKSLVAIFQPSEERAPGGAYQLIQQGLFQHFPIQIIGAGHVDPNLPLGTLGVRAGPFLASAHEWKLTFRGGGGHATLPHQSSGNALTCAMQFWQTVQARHTHWHSPLEPILLHLGILQAGRAPNIIPEQAFLHGTLRTFSDEVRARILKELLAVARQVATLHGCTVEAHLPPGYPVLVNNSRYTAHWRKVLDGLSWFQGRIQEVPPRMGADDFAWYTQYVPGVYWRVGVRTSDEATHRPLHHPEFLPPDDAVLWMARTFLGTFFAFQHFEPENPNENKPSNRYP